MKIEFDITEHLTSAEIKQICSEELRTTIRKNAERVLTNNAYSLLGSIVDEVLTDEHKTFIIQEVNRICTDPSAIKYEVFRTPDAWNSRNTFPVSDIIRSTALAQQDVIKEKVSNAINSIDLTMLVEQLDDYDRAEFMLSVLKFIHGKTSNQS